MFPQLGRAVSTAFRRVGTLVVGVLTLNEREMRRAFATAHLSGRRAAMAAHGTRHGIRARLTPAEVEAWRQAATSRAAASTTLAISAIETGGVTVGALERYAGQALRVSIWGGVDDEGNRIADQAGAQFKEWVRVFPRVEHRDHHDELEGTILPVDALFVLPGGRNAGSKVYAPRDWDRVRDAGEWIECGHALRFHNEVRRRSV